MLRIFYAEWKESWKTTHPSKRRINKFLKRNKRFEGNILIPWTTNYTTYIYSDWFHVRVDTCNNTLWIDKGLKVSEYVDTNKEGYTLRDKTLFLDLDDFRTKSGLQRHNEEIGKLYKNLGVEVNNETKKLFRN